MAVIRSGRARRCWRSASGWSPGGMGQAGAGEGGWRSGARSRWRGGPTTGVGDGAIAVRRPQRQHSCCSQVQRECGDAAASRDHDRYAPGARRDRPSRRDRRRRRARGDDEVGVRPFPLALPESGSQLLLVRAHVTPLSTRSRAEARAHVLLTVPTATPSVAAVSPGRDRSSSAGRSLRARAGSTRAAADVSRHASSLAANAASGWPSSGSASDGRSPHHRLQRRVDVTGDEDPSCVSGAGSVTACPTSGTASSTPSAPDPRHDGGRRSGGGRPAAASNHACRRTSERRLRQPLTSSRS